MTAVEDEKVDQVETALRSLLRHYPKAWVAAATGDSSARPVRLPDSVGIGADYYRFEKSLLDLVSPSDKVIVTRVWSRARAVGHGSATLQLHSDPPVSGTLHMFDVRHLYGVMAVVFTEGNDSEVPELIELEGNLPPARVARMVKDGGSVIVDADAGLSALLGWSREEVVGHRSLELIHPDDHDKGIENWVRMLDFPGSSRAVRLRHRHRDGHWVWLEVHNHNRLADPQVGNVIAQMVDISEEVAAQEAVLARQQLLEQLTETLPIGLFHADLEGNLLYVNRRLTEITGLPVGSRLADWPGIATVHFLSIIGSALRTASNGRPTESIVDVVDPAGNLRHCSLSVRPLADQNGSVGGVTGAIEDITETLLERRELELRAATDALTGCLNRSAAVALLQDALDGLGRDERPDGVAAIFVDVDGLKELNDRLGHSAGDRLLSEVAKRLGNAVRSRDKVGRYGGDEFVVLALHVRSVDHALTVARWIASRTLSTVTIEGEEVDIRVSLGVAWTDDPDVRADRLIRQADAAMYQSKQGGRCEPVLAPVAS